jgi:hypothetical protein
MKFVPRRETSSGFSAAEQMREISLQRTCPYLLMAIYTPRVMQDVDDDTDLRQGIIWPQSSRDRNETVLVPMTLPTPVMNPKGNGRAR